MAAILIHLRAVLHAQKIDVGRNLVRAVRLGAFPQQRSGERRRTVFARGIGDGTGAQPKLNTDEGQLMLFEQQQRQAAGELEPLILGQPEDLPGRSLCEGWHRHQEDEEQNEELACLFAPGHEIANHCFSSPGFSPAAPPLGVPGAFSWDASGTRMPTVRLFATKYCLTTRWISATPTLLNSCSTLASLW